MKENKREKPEDFIGWKSEDGLLEVIGIVGKDNRTQKNTTFKVTCMECSKDTELFPNGYFVSNKWDLKHRKKPCGCSKRPNWTKAQYLILARRVGEGRFIVHGFAEEFHGKKTKLSIECLLDNHKWSPSIDNIINIGSGCPKCADNAKRTDEKEASDKCKAICKIEGYEPIGFVDGYKNQKSIFDYKCPKHGNQNISYSHFINYGVRCRWCYKDRQKEEGNGNGYFPERKDEQDFLYVLDFDNKFIKVGRSFDIDKRIKGLRTKSKVPIKKIHKLRIFTATHQEIYDLEQTTIEELRERGFQHKLHWSSECFENNCLFMLNRMLDNCGLKEVLFI